ncbi:MAG: phosphatase PAP2 family protein [Chloroflexota bacterium]
MAKEVKNIAQQSADVIAKPVNQWRQTVKDADAIAEKPARHYRALIFQSYVIGAIILFVVLAVLAKTIAYFTFDVTITHEIQEFHVWWFDAFMYSLTWIGFTPQAPIISAVIIVFLFVSGLKWESVVSTLSLMGISLLGLVIKLFVARPRPSADLVNVLNQLNSYSFPSAHVLYFTTFFGFLLFLVFTLLKHSWLRIVLLIMLSAMIGLIGMSRIYEGQHWASDVFAAYLLGSVWLSLSIYVYRWGKSRFFADQPAAKETPS